MNERVLSHLKRRTSEELGGRTAAEYRRILAGIAILAILAMTVLSLAYPEQADADDPITGACGGLHWKLEAITTTTEDDYSLKITKEEGDNGYMADYTADNPAPWKSNTYKSKITAITVELGAITIGAYAFFGLENVTTIAFVGADQIQSIGDYAFKDCVRLNNLQLQNLENLRSIGAYAFANCSALTGSLTFPQNITTISQYAFNACSGLDDTLSLPEELINIEDRAFENCRFTGTLKTPYSLEKIGAYAFTGCKFNSLTLSDSVVYIGEHAFENVPFSCEFKFPGHIEFIGAHAFNGSTFTGTPVIPGTLKAIENYAFYNCYKAENSPPDLMIPNGVQRMGASAFGKCVFNKLTVNADLIGVTEPFSHSEFKGGLEIPDSTKRIQSNLYKYAIFHGVLYIPSSVTTISSTAFQCSTFYGEYKDGKSVKHVISDSVTTIDGSAFSSCKFYDGKGTDPANVGELVISINLTTVGGSAFRNCTAVVDYLILSSNVSSIGGDAFNFDLKKLTVSKECKGISNTAFQFPYPQKDYEFWTYNKTKQITDFSSADFLGHTFIMEDPAKRVMVAEQGETKEHKVTYDQAEGKGTVPIPTYYFEGYEFAVYDYTGTREGYLFKGWLWDGKVYEKGQTITMGESDITFVAQWKEGHYVYYDIDGGSGKAPDSDYVDTGSSFTVKGYTGTKTGYSFEGWTCNGVTYKVGAKVTMGSSNMVMIAKWIPVHKVSYDIDGGSGSKPSDSLVEEGAEFHLKSYSGTKTGCLYEGWIYDGKIYKAGDTITMGKKDITILAVWTETHSVTYDLNGGTGTAPTQSDVAKGHSFTVQGCTATKEGYVFKGWSYDRLTFQEGDVITMELGDITLTAIWKKGQPLHKVTYDINGGSGTAPIQADVEEGATFTVKLYNGTKEGFVFKGWSYDDKTYNMGATITMGSKDIVLTAIWGSNEPEKKDDNTMMILMAAAAIGGFAAVLAIGITIIRRP
ncbi:MAG: leucine-rich repeat protein [Candidatus Methanomethylophilaceae archaeon]|nr:leucine-rich repeat protein [Candidatus Methanomethylophilaceae archaeon]